MNIKRSATLELPKWLDENFVDYSQIFIGDEQKMRLAIALSERNIVEDTGGPFGACVFESDTGKLVSVGVNVVVNESCSLAHAEVMALILAEQSRKSFDLSINGTLELVTSAQPCIQCFGALHWSGIQRLVYGATGADVEILTGFDEGPLPERWEQQLDGIEVCAEVLRTEACAVLQKYRGPIYNALSNSTLVAPA